MDTAPATQLKPNAAAEIERLGFGWTEVANFDLTQLDPRPPKEGGRLIQVRESSHYAPKETVEQFAVAMGEVAFPPIVITRDNWIVDGNTRVRARIKRKEKFSPALVLDVEYENANAKRRSELIALAATLNQMGGLRLTAKEVREAVVYLIDLGWKTEQIGRAIGAKSGTVTMVKKEIEAAKKLRRVGLDSNGSLKGASLRALGSKDVLALNDVPFKELAKLSADAGLNASEITDTAKEVRSTGADNAGLEVVRKLRTEYGDRIKDRELTGHGKPPVSRRLRQNLGYITKFVGREQELLETDPKVNESHIKALEQAVGVLTEVLRMQKG